MGLHRFFRYIQFIGDLPVLFTFYSTLFKNDPGLRRHFRKHLLYNFLLPLGNFSLLYSVLPAVRIIAYRILHFITGTLLMLQIIYSHITGHSVQVGPLIVNGRILLAKPEKLQENILYHITCYIAVFYYSKHIAMQTFKIFFV